MVAATLNQVQDPGGKSGALKALDELFPHERGVFRGLEDDGIPLEE